MGLIKWNFQRKMLPNKSIQRVGREAIKFGKQARTAIDINDLRRERAMLPKSVYGRTTTYQNREGKQELTRYGTLTKQIEEKQKQLKHVNQKPAFRKIVKTTRYEPTNLM